MSASAQMLCDVREGDFMLCLSSPRLTLFHCIADCKISITVQSVTVFPVWIRFPTGLKEFMRGPTDEQMNIPTCMCKCTCFLKKMVKKIKVFK